MSKNLTKIHKALPHLKDDKSIQEAAEELDRLQEIAVYSKSNGGQEVIRSKRVQCRSILLKLMGKLEKPDLLEMVALISEFKATWVLLSELAGATEEANLQQKILDEIIEDRS